MKKKNKVLPPKPKWPGEHPSWHPDYDPDAVDDDVDFGGRVVMPQVPNTNKKRKVTKNYTMPRAELHRQFEDLIIRLEDMPVFDSTPNDLERDIAEFSSDFYVLLAGLLDTK